MAQPKFTWQQINRFNDRMENCLVNPQCRDLLKDYLKRRNNLVLLKTLELWKKANDSDQFDADEFLDLIEEIPRFNQGPLLTMEDNQSRFSFIKSECCRLLKVLLPLFIDHLRQHHMASSC